MVGYALLGATWLIMKTDGSAAAARLSRSPGSPALGTLALIGVVSLWTPFLNPQSMARWFAWPAILYIAPVPLLVALAAFVLLGGLARGSARLRRSSRRSRCSCCRYVGLGISFYPYIVPPTMTIWSAAAPGRQPRASCWSAPLC